MTIIRQHNLDHLQELMDTLGSPTLPTKNINTLVALRKSWASKKFLNDRELALMRSIASQYNNIKQTLLVDKEKANAVKELGVLHKAMEELEEKGLVVKAPIKRASSTRKKHSKVRELKPVDNK